MKELPLPFLARLGLSFSVLFDGLLARRVAELVIGMPSLPAPEETPETRAATAPTESTNAAEGGALGLLSTLQREGRLVDFVRQAIEDFPDADVGAAARVVHSGCRRALEGYFDVEPIRAEAEGSTLTLPPGFDGAATNLVGNVQGPPPYRGVLRHAGWRVTSIRVPRPVARHDARIIAPAEVEL